MLRAAPGRRPLGSRGDDRGGYRGGSRPSPDPFGSPEADRERNRRGIEQRSLRNARSQVRRWGLRTGSRCAGRRLSVLKEAGMIVIAGWAPHRRLDQGREKLSGLSAVLQPNTEGSGWAVQTKRKAWETSWKKGEPCMKSSPRAGRGRSVVPAAARIESNALLGPSSEGNILAIKNGFRNYRRERIRAGPAGWTEEARAAAQLEEEIAQWRRLRNGCARRSLIRALRNGASALAVERDPIGLKWGIRRVTSPGHAGRDGKG